MSNSFATPWTVVYKAPLSMGFPRQDYCSLLQGIFSNQGLKLHLLQWQAYSFLLSHQGSPYMYLFFSSNSCPNCFCCSVTQSCLTLWTRWTAACQGSLSFTVSQSLLKLVSIESMMPSSHLILCRSLLLLPQSFPASQSLPMSQLFPSGGQSFGASASFLPVNIQG